MSFVSRHERIVNLDGSEALVKKGLQPKGHDLLVLWVHVQVSASWVLRFGRVFYSEKKLQCVNVGGRGGACGCVRGGGLTNFRGDGGDQRAAAMVVSSQYVPTFKLVSFYKN